MDTINQNLTVEDVVFNELLMFKVSIPGYFDNTNLPRFTTYHQILNNYALGIFRFGSQ